MQSADNPPAPRRASRSALWFFLLLTLAATGAVATPILYNLRQQLRPEQLTAAQERWKQNGPGNYDLFFQSKHDSDPRPDEHHVIVRDGKVWVVFVNKDVLLSKELAAPLGGALGSTIGGVATERLAQRELTGYTIEGLFKTIADNLDKNAASGGKNFATASFDPKDGHPIRYIYRDKGKRERLEWNVRLERR